MVNLYLTYVTGSAMFVLFLFLLLYYAISVCINIGFFVSPSNCSSNWRLGFSLDLLVYSST